MGDKAQMLEFMLTNTLKDKPEDEVYTVVKGVYDKVGEVLYPPDEKPQELDPTLFADETTVDDSADAANE